MNVEWWHEPGDTYSWECWANKNKPQIRVMRVNEPGFAYYAKREYALGYYIVVNHDYDHPDVLPLDRTIDDVLATAIVVARMSSPKEES